MLAEAGWAERVNWAALAEAGLVQTDQERAEMILRFNEVAFAHLARVGASTAADVQASIYRLWSCFEYHWRRLSEPTPIDFEAALDRVESGRLAYGAVPYNVLADVALAVALEGGFPAAVERFERELMPVVRRIAAKVGGERAVEAVDNFAAELFLPRSKGQPRIASFAGKTPLAYWLRAVVANYWFSVARESRAGPMPGVEVPDGGPQEDSSGDCEELLKPAFQSAAEKMSATDRVLLKLLILDGAPQGALARIVGVHSGTLTRRRQHAERTLWSGLKRALDAMGQRTRVDECLEEMLAGEDPELRRALAAALADAVRIHATDQEDQTYDGHAR